MVSEEQSDYSDLTAGHYEGEVLKRERNYKWKPYWCVLFGRLLTFYEDSDKSRIAGRIEIQPGSRCDKEQAKGKLPRFPQLFHRDYMKLKKYSLRLQTKKGTHLFAYQNVKEQTRWQMAMNNASQINASGVRLSWIPTPFSMMTSPEAVKNKRQSLTRTNRNNKEAKFEDAEITVTNRATQKMKAISGFDDTHNLIAESDSETPQAGAYTNPSLHKELVTTL